MSAAVRRIFVQLFASPEPEPPVSGGRVEQFVVAAASIAVGVWIFAYKIQSFLGLATTSDLYQFTQLATSWLDGKFLQDNCYGHHLSIHTYFFCPVLGVLAYPFGAVGLLMALAVAGALSALALIRILGLLGVPGRLALFFASIVVLMPLSVHVYQDEIYGFHIELLAPALALWLAYFLLRRHWLGSLGLSFVLWSLKEDSPLLVAIIAGAVLAEDTIREAGKRTPRNLHKTWNRPAAAVLLLSVLVQPALLYFLKTQAMEGNYVTSSFKRLHPVDGMTITGGTSLLSYVLTHVKTWLASPQVLCWLQLALAATFGLAILRPHLLIVGIGTTLVAWLMQDDLLWAPRLAHALVFFQIVGSMAFASVHRVAMEARRTAFRGRLISVTIMSLMSFALVAGFVIQLHTVPNRLNSID